MSDSSAVDDVKIFTGDLKCRNLVELFKGDHQVMSHLEEVSFSEVTVWDMKRELQADQNAIDDLSEVFKNLSVFRSLES